MGIIEVEMFSEDVDDLEHPVVQSFRELLEEVAGEYECHLESFEVSRGTVSFSFDNDELEAEVLKLLDTK